MKLAFVAASPFVRKVRILIMELGLENSVLLQDIGAVTPISNNPELNEMNPLGMVPALVLDDGGCLYDSPVICEYLNHFTNGPFFPAEPTSRFKTLELQALGDGLLDLSVALRYELAVRPQELQWREWIDNQNIKINRGLDALEVKCKQFESEPLIGEITIACVLGYRDFRYADDDWRTGRPNLANWYANIMQRNSLQITIPS